MNIEGWNELAKLNWPNLIAAAAKDMTFHIATAGNESWLFPEPLQGEMSSTVKGAAQVRAYIYARNATIEIHKRVAEAAESASAALPAISSAVAPYRALEDVLRANVIRPPAFAGNVTQFAGREAKPDKWTAVAAYQIALAAAANDLLERKGAKAVMGWCQSNGNLSPLWRSWGRGGEPQAMRDRHSAKAAERLALKISRLVRCRS